MEQKKIASVLNKGIRSFVLVIAIVIAIVFLVRFVLNSRPAVGEIGFSSTTSGNADIYLMQADGSDVRRLTTDNQDEYLNDWSPDGRQLIFHVGKEGSGEVELYSMDTDGSNRRQLTQNDSDDGLADWSPDGNKIVFVSNRDGNYEIYTMNTDGTNQRRLTYTDANEYGPAWSPDGTEIVFDSYDDRSRTRKVYIMNSGGSNVRRLTDNDDDISEQDASWSPDGLRIIFALDLQIAIVNLDGSNVNILTNGSPVKLSPKFSPDGQYIVYLNNDPSARMGVWTMNADGSNQRRLTANVPDDQAYYAQWRP